MGEQRLEDKVGRQNKEGTDEDNACKDVVEKGGAAIRNDKENYTSIVNYKMASQKKKKETVDRFKAKYLKSLHDNHREIQ